MKESPKFSTMNENSQSDSIANAIAKKPYWIDPLSRCQDEVGGTRDLLGETPVKEKGIESRSRWREPSDHNAGLILMKGEKKERPW